MRHLVAILEIGAEGPAGFSARARDLLASATWVAGGKRHLGLVGRDGVETFAIGNNLAELVERLRGRGEEERCVVLASGDPLFYGIGHRLAEDLGPREIVVEPAVSSVQLAFARAGLAWHDAAIASIHGRPLAKTLLPLLGRPKIGLFTQDGTSPASVAAFFLDRGLDRYDAWVGERLGTDEERVTAAPLADLAGRTFDPLNFLVLRRAHEAAPVAAGEGPRLDDTAFAQPESGPILLTHADVRAVVLARFQALPEGPIWDVGAGLGGVAVTLARAFPDREVVALERSPVQAGFLRTNRTRFGVYNLRVVEGEAPAALGGEAQPAGVFVGGSGGRLDAILTLVFERLLPGGTLVANFIGLENLAQTLERLRDLGWPAKMTQVQISHGRILAGLTALAPQVPVFVVKSVRP